MKRNSNKAPETDVFSAILLKAYKRVLARPLQFVFQSFDKTDKFPRKLKEGKLCPLQEGSGAEVNNYRPISLTSNIFNVMV